MKICCICGNRFEGYGNNPAPVENIGECCDACHAEVVIPRRLRDANKTKIQAEADALTFTPLSPRESKKLNALVGKLVEVDFGDSYDGDIEVGILHKDTLATYTGYPDDDNTTLRGYWLDRVDGALHFRKSHVKHIRAATEQETEQINTLVGKSVFIKFNNGSEAAGFLHKETTTTDNGAPITHYYVETPLRRIRFYRSDVKSIREH